MGSPTINDVASRADVSKATVSAVINDSDSVRDSTRSRVMEVINALNYRPRASAQRGFRASRAKSIGLIIKEVENPYYAGVIAGMRNYANENGYTLLVASSEADYDDEQRIVDVFKAQDVDGLLVVPVLNDDTDLSYLYELKRRNFPFVLLEEIRGVQANLVDINNVAASKKAVKHLIGEGHERIAHFAGPSYSTHTAERIEGVRRAFSESQLVFGDDVIVRTGDTLKEGYEAGRAFFEDQADPPTAVFCYNDLVAIGLARALREMDYEVGRDVSIIGCDNIELLDYLPVPISSIEVPLYEMGRKATELLVQRLDTREQKPSEKVYLDADLVLRDGSECSEQNNPHSSLETVQMSR
jgi:DNA-binding LacI/PurR family transcriptional regulator